MYPRTVVLPSGEPASPLTPSYVGAGTSPIIHPYSIAAMPKTICATNLDNIGFRMESHSSGANISIKALKRVEVDRIKVTQSEKQKTARLTYGGNVEILPIESSDDEVTEIDGDLLAHLIKDVSEVDIEMEDLDMRICDLMASSCKSRKNRKQSKRTRKSLP